MKLKSLLLGFAKQSVFCLLIALLIMPSPIFNERTAKAAVSCREIYHEQIARGIRILPSFTCRPTGDHTDRYLGKWGASMNVMLP